MAEPTALDLPGPDLPAPDLPAPDLTAAAAAVSLAEQVVSDATRHLAANGGIDANQVVAYDLAHAAAATATARATLEYGARGDVEARIAGAFEVGRDQVGHGLGGYWAAGRGGSGVGDAPDHGDEGG